MRKQYDIQCSTLGYFEMIVLHFSIQKKDNIEHIHAKCHMFTFYVTCRPFGNIRIHLITLLSILMPIYSKRSWNPNVMRSLWWWKLLIIGSNTSNMKEYMYWDIKTEIHVPCVCWHKNPRYCRNWSIWFYKVLQISLENISSIKQSFVFFVMPILLIWAMSMGEMNFNMIFFENILTLFAMTTPTYENRP